MTHHHPDAAEALAHEPRHAYSHAQLAGAFFRIGMLGFGGVAASARRVLVAERRWFDDEEYAALLGMGQTLPGANTVNLGVLIGDRAQGISGALTAVTALLAPPLLLLLLIMVFYDQVENIPVIKAMLRGMASTGAGLVFGTGITMAWSLRRRPFRLIFGALSLVCVALLHVPLVWTALGVGALSMAYAAWTLRRRGAVP